MMLTPGHDASFGNAALVKSFNDGVKVLKNANYNNVKGNKSTKIVHFEIPWHILFADAFKGWEHDHM